MSEIKSIFRKNCKKLRKAAGFSQTAYAKAIGVHVQTVKGWESEEGGLPELGRLPDLARPLNVLPEAFISHAIDPTPRNINEALQMVTSAREQLQKAEDFLHQILSGRMQEEPSGTDRDVLGESI